MFFTCLSTSRIKVQPNEHDKVDEVDIETTNPNEQNKVKLDMTDKLNKIIEERNESRSYQYRKVVQVGISLIFIGCFIFLIDFSVYQNSSREIYPEELSRCLSASSLLLCNIGVLTISTVPLKLLNLDKILESPDSKFKWLRFVIGFSQCFLGFSFVVVPPYSGVLLLICGSSVLPTCRDFSPYLKTSYKMSTWFICFPLVCSLMFAYFSQHAGNITNNCIIFQVKTIPDTTLLADHFLFFAVYYFLAFIIFLIYFFYRMNIYWKSDTDIELLRTQAFYISLYCWLILFGLGLLIQGIWLMLIANVTTEWNLNYFGGSCLAVGLSNLIPVTICILLGPENVFNYMARQLDRDPDNQKKDGAFIATLLDDFVIIPGQDWWIHRDEPLDMYDKTDFNRNWCKGKVGKVQFHGFDVEIDGKPVKFQETPDARFDTNTLIKMATENLKYIDWNNLSVELFEKSVRDTSTESLYEISKKINKGEVIDFFISHSWDDPAKPKYEALEKLTHEFSKEFNREPKFWLDKVCINQSNIGNGLKVLPINVMACKQLLVICSPTYVTRLWCIW